MAHGHSVKKKPEVEFLWVGILIVSFVIWGFSAGGTASTIICIVVILAGNFIPLLIKAITELIKVMIAATKKSSAKKGHHPTDHHGHH